jgi:tetratricopeptide (TPR) repeat protein
VAVTGLGGVGKTQLVLAYIQRHETRYHERVFWLPAQDPETLDRRYADIAARLRLPGKDTANQAYVVHSVRLWLEENEDWLLVFDNAESTDILRRYLPAAGRGHVLVTSRDQIWRDVPVVNLGPWSRAESMEFLAQLGGPAARARDDVAELLGDLPLAMEQAFAYVRETGTSLADYRRLLETRDIETHRMSGASSYETTVLTTWRVSIERVRLLMSPAVDLFSVLIFFAPEGIPRGLVHEAGAQISGLLGRIARDDLGYDRLVAALARYSLISITDETIAVHRLVRTYGRHRLSRRQAKRFAGTAVRVIQASLPADGRDHTQWWICARLLPHALEAAAAAEQHRAEPEITARLLTSIGIYLQASAQLTQAHEMLLRALRLRIAARRQSDALAAESHNNVGVVLRILGSPGDAREHHERALAIHQAQRPLDRLALAADHSYMGLVLRSLGNPAEALRYLQDALELRGSVLDQRHPRIGTDHNNLALVLRDCGILHEARQHHEQALSIHRKALGDQHPSLATDLGSLGDTLRELTDITGAVRCHRQALAIRAAAFGLDHPAVATSLNNLAVALFDSGDVVEAQQSLTRAMKINTAVYGLAHPRLAVDFNNRAVVLDALGDARGALDSHERALEIARRCYEPQHPVVQKITRGGILLLARLTEDAE